MYCKDCFHRNQNRKCCCEKLKEDESIFISDDLSEKDDELRYSYNEGGCFEVGDNFGCVHFKQK